MAGAPTSRLLEPANAGLHRHRGRDVPTQKAPRDGHRQCKHGAASAEQGVPLQAVASHRRRWPCSGLITPANTGRRVFPKKLCRLRIPFFVRETHPIIGRSRSARTSTPSRGRLAFDGSARNADEQQAVLLREERRLAGSAWPQHRSLLKRFGFSGHRGLCARCRFGRRPTWPEPWRRLAFAAQPVGPASVGTVFPRCSTNSKP